MIYAILLYLIGLYLLWYEYAKYDLSLASYIFESEIRVVLFLGIAIILPPVVIYYTVKGWDYYYSMRVALKELNDSVDELMELKDDK